MKIFRLFVAFTLMCSVVSPRTQAVSPPPDGGYPNGNTAEGGGALFRLTTGMNNTALGFRALSNDTVGSANTAVGGFALFENTTGNENTAVGGNALFSNTTGVQNVAIGINALSSNTTSANTAIGWTALEFNETGNGNTAIGWQALRNSKGRDNTANGSNALLANTTGNYNAASGVNALSSNTSGERNTAIGFRSLDSNTTGNFNVALGAGAGSGVITADDVICIGRSVAGANVDGTCFIGNIRGVTTQNANALPVLIDGAGQLGTASSSQRFKHDIKPMGKASEGILALEPVTFHYKSDGANVPQFGLIAEEVEKVNPDLVVRDKNGEIYTVRYDAVNAMLLNEFLKEHRKNEEQQSTIAMLKSTDVKQEAIIAKQQKQIDALTAGLQKMSAQIELNRLAPQTVKNTD